jgi:hypothetical protein
MIPEELKLFSEFLQKGIKRLSAYFKKYIEDVQMVEILQSIQHTCTDEQLFLDTVNSLIESSKWFPTIRELKNAYTDKLNEKIKKNGYNFNKKSDCLICNGTGTLTIIKNNEDYAMACTCKAGSGVGLVKHRNEPLKYDPNFKLTEAEEFIYERLKQVSFKHLAGELCPF